MTIGQDYPDYQSYPNWRGPDLDAVDSYPLSSTNPFSVQGYVTNYASLTLYMVPGSSAGISVSVEFYTDATMSVSAGGFSWIVPESEALHGTIPVLSNYVLVEVTTTDATVAGTTIAVIPQSIYVASPTYHSDQNYISGFDVSVPASTTDTFYLQYVASGRCSIHFQDLAASGKVSVFLWTSNVAGSRVSRLYNSNNATGVIDVSLNVPSVPLLLQVDNSDTAAHSVDYYCCID